MPRHLAGPKTLLAAIEIKPAAVVLAFAASDDLLADGGDFLRFVFLYSQEFTCINMRQFVP
jgi:hypothetical protein